jgi:hypothetical protein
MIEIEMRIRDRGRRGAKSLKKIRRKHQRKQANQVVGGRIAKESEPNRQREKMRKPNWERGGVNQRRKEIRSFEKKNEKFSSKRQLRQLISWGYDSRYKEHFSK